MTLDLSRVWFEQQLDYLEAGMRRMEELNAMPWRFPGKRGPTRPSQPAPTGIRALAVAVVAFSARVRKRADRELLYRAARGEKLQAWELRRVEYLAIKATSKVGDAGTRRQSEPAAENVQGWTGPAAAVCQGSVMKARIGRRRGNGDACQIQEVMNEK